MTCSTSFSGTNLRADCAQDLVQDDEVVRAGSDDLDGALPAERRRGRMVVHRDARIAQTVDGEAPPRDFQVNAWQAAQDRPFAALPLTFDELQYEHTHVVAGGANHKSDGGRRFALAIAGIDDRQPVTLAALGSPVLGRTSGTARVADHRRTLRVPVRAQVVAQMSRDEGDGPAPPHRRLTAD